MSLIEGYVMQKIVHYISYTTDILESSIDLFIRIRKNNLSLEPNDERMGINYSIILNSACLLESKLEGLLMKLVYHYRNAKIKDNSANFRSSPDVNVFFNNMIDDMRSRVSRTTGINNYLDMFELLIDNFELSVKAKELVEGIKVLFQFRNILAHGRMFVAETITDMPYPKYEEENITEIFKGGYRQTDDYLAKKKIIDKSFFERGSIKDYFVDEVADFFYNLSLDFFSEIENSLPENLKYCSSISKDVSEL